MYIYINVCMYVYMYVCTYVYVYMYVCLYSFGPSCWVSIFGRLADLRIRCALVRFNTAWLLMVKESCRIDSSSMDTLYVCMYVCVWEWVWLYNVCMWIRMILQAIMQACIYVCMYVCMCTNSEVFMEAEERIFLWCPNRFSCLSAKLKLESSSSPPVYIHTCIHKSVHIYLIKCLYTISAFSNILNEQYDT